MNVSVIIPAYNAAATLAECLAALQHQTRAPDEVIVVDDGSTDRTAEIARAFATRVLQQANHGPAAARNLGAQNARGELILFTDADCEPSPDWVAQMVKPFADAQVIGVKGTYQTRQHEWVARFVQQEYASKYARMARQATIDFLDTYSAGYRTSVFLQNGGFETAFPVPSVEDQEFSFRLARKGYTMVFAPNAMVYHRHDRNLREYLTRKYQIGYWKAFMLRWIPEKTFADSHTPKSQRLQIGLLALILLGLPLMLWWLPAVWFVLVGLGLFFLSAFHLFAQIARQDRALLWLVPLLLLCRAGALGFGLLGGFVLAPSAPPRRTVGLDFSARFAKRLLDVTGAGLGLIATAPMLILAAIAIKLDSPGSILFVQTRAGENGKPFRMLKLRTMCQDAPSQVQTVLAKNLLKGAAYKIPNDPRVTRVGALLRRWSLDEVPQFWNVLRGEMSLVGPRPEELWVVAQYSDTERERLAFKPGMTGPMQINGRGNLDLPARLRLELEYIRHYSFARDLAILARTIPAIISGKGAF